MRRAGLNGGAATRRLWLQQAAALALPSRPVAAAAAGVAPWALAVPTASAAEASALERALRSPSGAGRVLVFRHALAPGTFDPPGFRLGDCSTQRNLSDAGRAQARQIGAWFAQRQLRPARVRSSPWCRCTETARLAFGDKVDSWAALGSPRAGTEEVNAQSLAQLKAELRQLKRRAAGFEVWVTHMFVISALVNEPVRSGEALLLGASGDGSPRVLERFSELAL